MSARLLRRPRSSATRSRCSEGSSATRLVTQAPGYLLRVEEGELDSRRLEVAVASGDLAELTEALALWRGPPLTQFTYEQFAQTRDRAPGRAPPDCRRGAGRSPARRRPTCECDRRAGGARPATPPTRAPVRAVDARAVPLRAASRRPRGLPPDPAESRRSSWAWSPSPALRELERKILNQDESLDPPQAAVSPEVPRRQRRPMALAAAALVLAAGPSPPSWSHVTPRAASMRSRPTTSG